jgi:hypothetical protein
MRAKFTVLLIAVVAAGATIQGFASSPAATERIPYLWQRCSHVNAKYPHGVGRRFAHDHTSGTPVTNFLPKYAALSRRDERQPGS